MTASLLQSRDFLIRELTITLRDIFTRIKNLGIEIMLGQKYGDFLKKSPNFVPRIKLAHFHPNLFKRNQTQFLKKFHN